mmetsp:Transcript_23053/g.22446  ORF Transcript_23053/g.22446 Transcript_23053/m.22446 type:complete len:84 (-) Transcript_23053:208-459(-)
MTGSNVIYESMNPNSTSSFMKEESKRRDPSVRVSFRQLSEIENNSKEEMKVSRVNLKGYGFKNPTNYKHVKKDSIIFKSPKES